MRRLIDTLRVCTLFAAAILSSHDARGDLFAGPPVQTGVLEAAVDPAAYGEYAPIDVPLPTDGGYGGLLGGVCHDGSGGNPCAFDSIWDVTGGRSPTDWICGYGPECHVAVARIEWLLWFSQGRQAPPLAAVVDRQGQATVYPDDSIGQAVRNGARITLGHLLADEMTWAEGRFWGVENGSEVFAANFGDTPTILRPYFNVSLNTPVAEQIARPGISRGNLRIVSRNDLFGADVWLRRTWCKDGCHQLDWLAGYQFARLNDWLTVDTASTLLVPVGPLPAGLFTSFFDSFSTQNEFHGGSLGFVSSWRKRAYSLEILGKIALGNVRQQVAIEGTATARTLGGPTIQTTQRGFLAQPSNIGEHDRNRFTFIPELNINGVIHFSPRWQGTIGYSLIYWDSAVLAGNQIDPRINFTQVPGPTVGPALPAFSFQASSFVVQGINFGLERRW